MDCDGDRNILIVNEDTVLIMVFMNMFTGLVAREKPRLEEGLRPFINEQPILMPYVHVLPPLGG